MRIRAYKYSLPLHQPLRMNSCVLDVRNGFLIRLDRGDKTGWGEAAPLDGYSRETVAEVAEGLPSFLSSITRDDALIDSPWASLNTALHFARTGLEKQIHDDAFSVETAALLHVEAPLDLRGLVGDALDRGYRCLKVKVGRCSIEDDVERMRIIHEMIPPGVQIRLDANRAWSLRDALHFCQSIDGSSVSFIEEPLCDEDSYVTFDQHSPIPFALDESLQWRTQASVEGLSRLHAFILKPSLLGPKSVESWTKVAQARKLDCIVSAMYESGVGMRSLIKMASTIPYSRVAAGLDTYSALADDLIEPGIQTEQGNMVFSGVQELNIHLKKLELIYDSN